jgi:hypothetical protein
MENSTEPYKGRLVDYLWALSILTIPTLVCIAVVAICLYICLVRPGDLTAEYSQLQLSQ